MYILKQNFFNRFNLYLIQIFSLENYYQKFAQHNLNCHFGHKIL